MRRFKNILFVVGDSTQRLGVPPRVVERARRNDASLGIVHVLRFPWSSRRAEPISEIETELEALAVDDWTRRLERIAAPLARQGVRTSTALLTGRPFLEIIRHVLRHGHDLVAIDAERRSLGAALFGTTSLHLIRKCPCPVWVLRPGRRKRFQRVLAAVDTNPYEALRPVSRTVLELAASQARLDGAELHVVNVWNVTFSQLLRRPQGMSEKRRQDYARKIRNAHRESLDKLLGRVDLSDLRVHVHVLKGSAGDVIPRLTARLRVEHLVMGSIRRVGVPGLLIGSTAERVLQQLRCSVLAVKPEGFVSPIRLD